LPMVRNWPVSTALGTQFYFFFELFFWKNLFFQNIERSVFYGVFELLLKS
jgi:hypothetical protein